MKSSSLRLLEEGIENPREYRDMLIHDWFLRSDYADKLEIHILKETKPSELFFHLSDDGELLIRGRSYSVTWINSPAKVREAEFALVSLRFCKFLNRGYALIKVLQDPQNHEFEKLEYT